MGVLGRGVSLRCGSTVLAPPQTSARFPHIRIRETPSATGGAGCGSAVQSEETTTLFLSCSSFSFSLAYTHGERRTHRRCCQGERGRGDPRYATPRWHLAQRATTESRLRPPGRSIQIRVERNTGLSPCPLGAFPPRVYVIALTLMWLRQTKLRKW